MTLHVEQFKVIGGGIVIGITLIIGPFDIKQESRFNQNINRSNTYGNMAGNKINDIGISFSPYPCQREAGVSSFITGL